MRYILAVLFVALLTAPVAAQQDDGTIIIRDVPVPDVIVNVADSVSHPVDLDVSIVVPQEMLAQQIAEANASASTGRWIDRGLIAAGILVAALGVHELRRYVNKYQPDVTDINLEDNDVTNVDVEMPDHHHPPGHHK